MQNFSCYTQNFNSATLLKGQRTHHRRHHSRRFTCLFVTKENTLKKTACNFCRLFVLQNFSCCKQNFNSATLLKGQRTHHGQHHVRLFAVYTAKLTVKKRWQVFRLFSTFSFPFIYLSRSFRCHSPTFSPDSKKVATIGISHFQCDVLPDFT